MRCGGRLHGGGDLLSDGCTTHLITDGCYGLHSECGEDEDRL